MERFLERDGFRQLFETAPDAVLIVDGDGLITLVNQQVERLFGYSRDELIGHEIEVLIPARVRGVHVGHRTRFGSEPRLRPMGTGLELFGCRKDGTEFPVEISLSPIEAEGASFTSASIRDVSERKRLEASARRLHQYLRSALDSMVGSILIWDAQDRLVACNSLASEQLNSTFGGEVVGRTWDELVPPFLKEKSFEADGQSGEDVVAVVENYHRRREGAFTLRSAESRTWRWTLRPTPEGGSVMVIDDITEAKQHEAELLRARSEAESASAAKSEFLSAMSHELRTPLNAVLGFAQLLQRDKKEPLTERHQDRLTHVLKGGEHLLRLIDDVLDLSRIESRRLPISMEPVAIESVLEDVRRTMAPIAAEANIALAVEEAAAALPRVSADRTRLRQIVMNYASNAIKYGRTNGSVRLVARPRGSVLRVSVFDDGIGIAKAKQARIFEPFHRAGQEAGPIQGTGIGLTICKQLAELMDGRVGFESVEGKGSEFWVELPILQLSEQSPEEGAVAVATPALSAPTLVRRSIVYVEDNPSNVAFMEDLLSDQPVELIVAPSAELGIELVRNRKPSLVIMDINLPGMNGIEAQRALQRWPETAKIPVVALSAAAMPGEATKIAEAGFYRFLTKPVRVDELLTTLEEILAKST